MFGVVAIYLVAFVVAGIPRGMWRFSGFGEIKRLTVACAAAGVASAAVVLGLQLRDVPRAVLALHPFVSLMGVCMVRIAYRMLYEHARARITGSDAEVRRAIVLGAGDAAKRLLAAIHHEGWQVVGPARRRPGQDRCADRRRAGARHDCRRRARRGARRRHARDRRHAGRSARRASARDRPGRGNRPAGPDGAVDQRAPGRHGGDRACAQHRARRSARPRSGRARRGRHRRARRRQDGARDGRRRLDRRRALPPARELSAGDDRPLRAERIRALSGRAEPGRASPRDRAACACSATSRTWPMCVPPSRRTVRSSSSMPLRSSTCR